MNRCQSYGGGASHASHCGGGGDGAKGHRAGAGTKAHGSCGGGAGTKGHGAGAGTKGHGAGAGTKGHGAGAGTKGHGSTGGCNTNPPPVDTNPPPVDTNPPPCGGNPPPVDTNPPPVDTNPPPCDNNPPACNNNPAPSQNSDGTVTFGNYNFAFSGSTLTMKNTCNGETTQVWGDPHITNPDGAVTTVSGNFTFNLGNGETATVIASNGAQACATVQQGCVAENSVAQQVVVTDGCNTATLNNDGTATFAQGGSNAGEGSLQLSEGSNKEWQAA